MIKASYTPNDPNWEIEADQYIEYYFEDEPDIHRYIGKLLILTGNSVKRIPQIYLSNPSSTQKVYLEIFMANQLQDDLDATSDLLQNINIISGLYYNNIISNDLNGTGSTYLIVTDIDNNIQLSIPYININTIELDYDNNGLIIGNLSEEKIHLRFLSEFNMKQAHSRINWVLEDRDNRNLTNSYPIVDTDYPVITWNFTGGTSGYTYIPSGDTQFIIDYFISGVTDNRDGIINKYDINLVIYEDGSLVPLTEITFVGQYTLLFTITDIAGNSHTSTRYASYFLVI
jgi:hypothetical protein